MPNVEITNGGVSAYTVEINQAPDGPYIVEISPPSSEPIETLLGEMQYSLYGIGMPLPNSSSVDGFRSWGDYAYPQLLVSGSYGTSGKAARFPTSTEYGGSNNSRYTIMNRIPRQLLSGSSHIKYVAYHKCPPSASFANGSGDGNRYLVIWGQMNLKTYGGNPQEQLTSLGIYSGSTAVATSSTFTTPVSGEWYYLSCEIKMSELSDGFVTATLYKASDSSIVSTLNWTGKTGKESDPNIMFSNTDATCHGFSSTAATSTDTTQFPIIGPTYVYNVT